MAAKERKVRIDIAPDPSTLYPGTKVTVSLKITEKDGTSWKNLPRTTTKRKTVTLTCAGFKGGTVTSSFRPPTWLMASSSRVSGRRIGNVPGRIGELFPAPAPRPKIENVAV